MLASVERSGTLPRSYDLNPSQTPALAQEISARVQWRNIIKPGLSAHNPYSSEQDRVGSHGPSNAGPGRKEFAAGKELGIRWVPTRRRKNARENIRDYLRGSAGRTFSNSEKNTGARSTPAGAKPTSPPTSFPVRGGRIQNRVPSSSPVPSKLYKRRSASPSAVA
ncbi:hypothetical protein NL676_000290 [Syzygium grande]|nr:hypothetical protein NL676_000290 [Syzygium grande]